MYKNVRKFYRYNNFNIFFYLFRRKNMFEKISILKQSNIVYLNGYWRYVDQKNKLATIGFKNKKILIKNKDVIRIDKNTIPLMRKRYFSLH